MKEETVEVNLRMETEVLGQFERMTKKELLNSLYNAILRSRVQDETIEGLLRTGEAEYTLLLDRITRAEIHVAESKTYAAQTRKMLAAITEGEVA